MGRRIFKREANTQKSLLTLNLDGHDEVEVVGSCVCWYNQGMTKIQINDHIVVDKNVCHGKPVFDGTRIMVWQVLSMLANGEKEKDILKAFPTLKRAHIRAAYDYASSITRESNVLINFNVA